MPIVNIDVDVELTAALSQIDNCDLITYLLESGETDNIIDQLEEDAMLARIDKATITDYACEHCAVDARHD